MPDLIKLWKWSDYGYYPKCQDLPDILGKPKVLVIPRCDWVFAIFSDLNIGPRGVPIYPEIPNRTPQNESKWGTRKYPIIYFNTLPDPNMTSVFFSTPDPILKKNLDPTCWALFPAVAWKYAKNEIIFFWCIKIIFYHNHLCLHQMLNCILGMVEKTQRAIRILQQRQHSTPSNLTNNRTTEEVVADLQTRANLAILEVAGVVLGNPEMGKVILRHC